MFRAFPIPFVFASGGIPVDTFEAEVVNSDFAQLHGFQVTVELVLSACIHLTYRGHLIA